MMFWHFLLKDTVLAFPLQTETKVRQVGGEEYVEARGKDGTFEMTSVSSQPQATHDTVHPIG